MGNSNEKCYEDRKKGLECTVENSFIIPETLSNAIYKSIGRIEIKKNEQNKCSTGFFMKIDINNKDYNFFLTCHHSIEEKDVNSKKIINIYYGKAKKEKKVTIKLDNKERMIKCFEDLDVTIIEILKNDNIKEDKYLFPDLNYKNGLSQYKNMAIYTGGYPNVINYNKDRHISSGTITKIENDTIYHTCDTRNGSSGSPLVDIQKHVIGIHMGSIKKEINYATFIGKIIDELNLEMKKGNIEIVNTNQNKKTLPNSNIKLNNLNKSNSKEEDPNLSPDFASSILKMSGMEGISPKSIAEIIKNPYIFNIMKGIYSNPNLMAEFSKLPEVNELKEKNPFAKLAYENPELVNQFLTPNYMNIFAQILSGEGNNNKEEFKKDNEKGKKGENDFINKESDIEEINMNEKNVKDIDKYIQYLILLKEMGFTDINLNLDLSIDCGGNFEKTLDLLMELGQK